MPRQKIFYFRKDFLWGASISSHQTEGNNYNDWSVWERKNAKRLAKEACQKFGHLDNWYKIEKYACDPQNYISGHAVDFWHKYRDDFNLAKSLGLKALRFSIEWSRIEPEKGKFDEKAIRHYLSMINALRKRGIEPFVTLWHWPLPVWLANEGGWKNVKTINYFCRYVKKICQRLKGKVKFLITINEPEIYAGVSYYQGVWPPQEKNFLSYLWVLNHLIVAHKKAYKIIKKISPKFKVSIAKNNVYFEAKNKRPINRLLKWLSDWWWNSYILNRIKNQLDFIGLNHYFRNLIEGGYNRNENAIVSGLGFELYPQSIYFVLKDLAKYKKPIYITENGLVDSTDYRRGWFIKEVLRNVHRAIHEGIDVRGYLHWSLLDNFEWDKGFWPRFGLIEVDYHTLERRIRPSAYEYTKIINDRAIMRPYKILRPQKTLL
ncbi:MAG: family 1 glycosylhydrolase [Candidatus Berkelbacteria bacterium]|nr:family 1 glycosylhydrolase [Candidatus Berkelbacteria bacterium]